MERFDCVDLFDYISEGPTPMSELEVQRMFSQVLRAVVEIHKLGIVHQDIKDENILVDRQTGRIKIIDFGCGAFLPENDEYFSKFQGKLSRSVYNVLDSD